MSEGRAEKDVVAEENVRAEGVVIKGDENNTVEQKTEAISVKRREFHERTMKNAEKTVDNQQKSEKTVEKDEDRLNKKQKKEESHRARRKESSEEVSEYAEG